MKNENNVLKYKIIFGFALICILLFSSCSDLLNDTINGDQGIIRIDFAQGNARSVFPLMVFDRFEYLFTKTGETIAVEKFPDDNGLFTLDVGDYTVEVLAYTDNNTLAASGVSAQFSVGLGHNAIVNVLLSSVISVGQGQFNYTVTYPAGAVAQITLQRWPDMSNVTLNPVSQGNGITQTLNNLGSGSYLLTIRATKDGATSGISEAIHIYPSFTTEYRKDFIEKDFLSIPISTAAELNAIRNNLSGNYKLVNDITLSGNWTPIGTVLNLFTGVFDGDGYTISGLTINSSNYEVGLFGIIGSAGIVKNLGLLNVNINNNSKLMVSGTGGVVGINVGIVQNCYVTGIVTGLGYTGGIAGDNSAGLIQNCYTKVNVTGRDTGGIVGHNSTSGIVKNCYSIGDVINNNNSNGWSGGIVGNNDGSVFNCYSTGSVFGDTLTGGIVGSNYFDGSNINCVALNPKVVRLEGDYPVYGRVVSSASISSPFNNFVSNNYGRFGMIVIATSITSGNHNDRHGANVTTSQAVTQAWWNAPSAGWHESSPWDFVNVWYPADGTKLPTLRNMPGGNTQNPVIQF